MHIDGALAQRLERALAFSAQEFVRIQLAIDAHSRARSACIGGHVVVDAGPHQNLNLARVYGLGLDGPVDDATLDDIEHFFDEGRCLPRVLLSPFVDAGLRTALFSRGFHEVRQDTVLVRALDDEPVERAVHDDAIDIVVEHDVATWTHLLAPAFGTTTESFALQHARHAPFVAPPNVALLAFVDGEIAGGAALTVAHETAYFVADGTRPEKRGRGVQSALIAARIAQARTRGATLAHAITAPGSTSERNYLRAGFTRAWVASILTRQR
jgi:GNAT superfamily N-acetyltransferase